MAEVVHHRFRHRYYCCDEDSFGAGAITFNALLCPRCKRWYLSDGPEVVGRISRMPWITAAFTYGLKQLKLVPPDSCRCAKIDVTHQGDSHGNRTHQLEAENAANHDEDTGRLGQQDTDTGA